MIVIRILYHAFPTATRPWPETLPRQPFQKVEQVSLQCGLRLDEHSDSRGAGWLSLKGVAAHDASSQEIEHLRGLRDGELSQFAFKTLNHKF